MKKHSTSLYERRANKVRIRTAVVRIHYLHIYDFVGARTTVVRRSCEHHTADVRYLRIVLRRCDLSAICCDGSRFKSYELARKIYCTADVSMALLILCQLSICLMSKYFQYLLWCTCKERYNIHNRQYTFL